MKDILDKQFLVESFRLNLALEGQILLQTFPRTHHTHYSAPVSRIQIEKATWQDNKNTHTLKWWKLRGESNVEQSKEVSSASAELYFANGRKATSSYKCKLLEIPWPKNSPLQTKANKQERCQDPGPRTWLKQAKQMQLSLNDNVVHSSILIWRMQKEESSFKDTLTLDISLKKFYQES